MSANQRIQPFLMRRPSGEIISPTLGKIWTSATSQPFLGTYYGMATNGSIVVMLEDASTNPLWYSNDFGDNWIQGTLANQRWRDVCYSPDLDLFCGVSIDGAQRVCTSPDGTNWTLRTHSTSLSWLAVCWGNGLFVAVGQTGGCMTSPDGINWTTRTTPSGTADYRKVIWVPDLGLFIAAGVNVIMTSPDGINWTARTMPVTFSVGGMSYNGSNVVFNKFNSSTVIAVISSDGINYSSSGTYAFTRSGQSVVYGQGKFFQITGGEIHYSEDQGATWSDVGVMNPPGSNPLVMCAVFVNNRIIAYNQNTGILLSE